MQAVIGTADFAHAPCPCKHGVGMLSRVSQLVDAIGSTTVVGPYDWTASLSLQWDIEDVFLHHLGQSESSILFSCSGPPIRVRKSQGSVWDGHETERVFYSTLESYRLKFISVASASGLYPFQNCTRTKTDLEWVLWRFCDVKPWLIMFQCI